jgi:hypothetical protein
MLVENDGSALLFLFHNSKVQKVVRKGNIIYFVYSTFDYSWETQLTRGLTQSGLARFGLIQRLA